MYSYSMRPKTATSRKEFVPGPGTYETKSTMVDIPSNKFGSENRVGMTIKSNIMNPGPGT